MPVAKYTPYGSGIKEAAPSISWDGAFVFLVGQNKLFLGLILLRFLMLDPALREGRGEQG